MKFTRLLKRIVIGGVAIGAALATMIGPTQPAHAASTYGSPYTAWGGPYGCLTVSVSGAYAGMYTFRITYKSTCTVQVKTQFSVLAMYYSVGLVLYTTGMYTFGPYSSGSFLSGQGTMSAMSPIGIYFGARTWCKGSTSQVC